MLQVTDINLAPVTLGFKTGSHPARGHETLTQRAHYRGMGSLGQCFNVPGGLAVGDHSDRWHLQITDVSTSPVIYLTDQIFHR